MPIRDIAKSKRQKKLTAKRLRELLHYDPETGVFRWVARGHNTTSGTVAGYLHKKGYQMIAIDGRQYRAHRLAWLYVHGFWPSDQIDHIDGIRHNNHIANLRQATNCQNCQNSKRPCNNTSGFKGASWHRQIGKWKAQIMVDGDKIYLGIFATAEEAHAAYCAAAVQHYGEFARFD